MNFHYSTLLEESSKGISVSVIMGDIMIDILLVGLFLGLNGALETLVSQAHGAKSLAQCGTVYKRAWVIDTLLFVPICACLLFTKDVLDLVGFEADMANKVQFYALLSIPKAYFLILFDLTKLYLGCFERTYPSMIS